MSQAKHSKRRTQTTKRCKTLARSLRVSSQSRRSLRLEPLERRCAMDATLGDWLMPMGPLVIAPVESVNAWPSFSHEESSSLDPGLSAQPMGPVYTPADPQEALPLQPDLLQPDLSQPDPPVLEPLQPGSSDFGDVETEVLEPDPLVPDDAAVVTPLDPPGDPEVTTPLDPTSQGDKTGGDSNHGTPLGGGAFTPGPLRSFPGEVSAEIPDTISLNSDRRNDVLGTLSLSSSTNAARSARTYSEHSINRNASDYLRRSETSLTSMHYFKSTPSESTLSQSLPVGQTGTRPLRRFTPMPAADDRGISIGALAAQRQRVKPSMAAALSQAIAGQSAVPGDAGQPMPTPHEAVVDLALTAMIGENSSRTHGNSVASDSLNQIRSLKAVTLVKAQRIDKASDPNVAVEASEFTSEVTWNEVTRNLTRFAVLGFILSKSVSFRTLRWIPSSSDLRRNLRWKRR